MESNKTWKEPQIGYVIEIPDETSIIINLGMNDGFKEGNRFSIFEKGPEVKDSKTGETLGRKDFVKSTVEIVELYDNFSVCKKIITENSSSAYSMASIIGNKIEKKVVNLPVEKEDLKNWKIQNKYIKINDPIKKA